MPHLILSLYLLALLAGTAALSQTFIMRSVIWILQDATGGPRLAEPLLSPCGHL